MMEVFDLSMGIHMLSNLPKKPRGRARETPSKLFSPTETRLLQFYNIQSLYKIFTILQNIHKNILETRRLKKKSGLVQCR